MPYRLRQAGVFPFLCAVVAGLSLALIPRGLAAQTFDATHLYQRTPLAATWLVHAGDDPSYARPDFDDSQWTKFNSTQNLASVFPHSRPEIVWYRLHVKVATGEKDLYIPGAFEVYTNGVLLMHVGRIQPFVASTSDARSLGQFEQRPSSPAIRLNYSVV
jgi:hypothetical protein